MDEFSAEVDLCVIGVAIKVGVEVSKVGYIENRDRDLELG